VNHWQPIHNMGFVEGLAPSFNGALNICRHRKVISTRNHYKRCCSHFR